MYSRHVNTSSESLETIQVINNSRIQKHRFCEVHAYVRAQYAEIYSFLGYEVADIF